MELNIEYLPVEALRPYDRNARKHAKKDIDAIAASIREFGFDDPIGIWGDGLIVEGHGRLLAAKQMGMTSVPCIRLDHLTDEQRRAYTLAHNRTAELSGWDFDMQAAELAEITEIDMSEFGFDLDSIVPEVKDDDYDPEPPAEPKAQRGDIYQLGRHRLMCGDSTVLADVYTLMNCDKADLFLTDPPYNVDYTGGTSDNLKIENDNFASDEEAGALLWKPAFINARIVANDCCSVFCFMPQGGTHMMMMMMMMRDAGWQVKHELIWKKNSLVLGRQDYNYQHEPILFGWNKTHHFIGNGRFAMTSIWEYDRPTRSKEHPTMKPLELMTEPILDTTITDQIVLDLFGGSGSTLLACEQTSRVCRMMELDPRYVDVIIDRWEKFTGETAVKLN